MAVGTDIRTYFNGTWHDGDIPIMRAADHGSWLGTTVFDGARFFDGVSPRSECTLRPREPLSRRPDDHTDGDNR